MKRFSILLFLFSATLSAQYARMQFLLQNAQGQAISGASVYVYSQTACGAAAGALATIYPSANGGTPTQQPLHTNGKGEAHTYAAPGCYTVVYNSPSTGTQTYPDQIVGGNGPQGPPGPQGIPGSGNIFASGQYSMMFQPLAGSQQAAQGDSGITTNGGGALTVKKSNMSGATENTSNNSAFATRQNSWQPGYNLGNTPVGPGGWQTIVHNQPNLFVNGSGITETFGFTQQKQGSGDNIPLYAYVYGNGNANGYSDEGTKPLGLVNNEYASSYTGTCATGCTAGAVAIKTTCVTGCGALPTLPPQLGTDQYFIDTTQAPTQCKITNAAAGLGIATAVTLSGCTIAASTYGTLNSNVLVNPVVVAAPYTASVTFNATIVGGTAFNTTDVVCFDSQHHECTIPTAVGTPSGSVQSITANLQWSHASGSRIYQSGMAGTSMDNPTFDVTPAGGQKLRYLFDVLGCISTTVCEVQQWGPRSTLQFFPSYLYQTINLANCSSAGSTTVGCSYVAGGSTLATPTQYNNAVFLLSSSSDSALNANCTGVAWTTSTTFTCTIAGLTGNHSTATAVAQLSQAGSLQGINNAYLYPSAVSTDVQNNALNPPTVDGTIALQPNAIQFAPGDTIEQARAAAGIWNLLTAAMNVYNPYSQNFNSLLISSGGQGTSGGTSSTMAQINNTNPDTTYQGNSGNVQTPLALKFTGNYLSHMTFDHYPNRNGAFLNLTTAPAFQTNDPTFIATIFTDNTNGNKWTTNPFYKSMNFLSVGEMHLGSQFSNLWNGPMGAVTVNDNLTFTNLAAPSAPTLTAFSYGGVIGSNIPDATSVCYKIAARNNAGIGLPSTETCVTTGSTAGGTNSIKVVWPHVAGGIKYNICRGATGAELQMAIVTGIDATTYIDTGAVTPSGACNATDGSRAWIEHSAKFCANSSGTAFDTCIVAPAGVAANYLATLPETGTAGSLVDKAAGATVVDHIVTFSNITGRIKDSGTLLTGLAPLASPTFTGTPASVTPATADNSTAIATTAFVKANLPLKIAVSITPAATTASTCAEQTFNTFTGLATGQGVSVSPPALPGANVWIGSVRVSAANTLAIGFCANATGGTAAAGTYTAVAF